MPLPNLRVPREEAKRKIDARLQIGRELRDRTTKLMFSQRDLESARAEKSKWVNYTKDLLELLFDNASMAEEFAVRYGQVGVVAHSFHQDVDQFRESMDDYLQRLESIHERLDLMQELEKPISEKPRTPASTSTTVFISHSSDDGAVTDVVKQAFEDLNLEPIFNEKQPAGGSPAHVISERIEKSKALFAFFTSNSINNMDTRDWIIFELGLALAHGKKIFSWKDEGVQVVPKLIEQVTTYRSFETYSSRGALKLTGEVRRVAKQLA